MVALKKKEILAGLKKFGIDNTAELTFYLREYKNYYALHNYHIDSQQEDNRAIQSNHILRGKIVNRINRITRVITLHNR
jgi:hypothetical protein